ncbi:MAG: mannose-1-phosphate guanylyltransferase/mannose-6-phosphate isomerase [Geobacteraceae bacterium GWC2_53_11]|nr:MAG: mannose-1-phosphate guanylyltransferase/mannose-6-phosphate isomerase [Geobacteraceae bacterium GWC2_53_11]
MIIPVILSGGSGSRLWPVSREMYPKQLLPLVGQSTMLQETVVRLRGIGDCADPVVVCNEDHRFMVAEQLRSIGSDASVIMLEPFGRNTAPAVALAALEVLTAHTDPLLLILPADHVITDVAAFQQACLAATAYALQGKLVTFGITPHAAETGYGYIQKGALIPLAGAIAPAFGVERFVEKPDQQTAEQYLQTGSYLWNSGMFLFSAQRYLDELQKFAPGMVAACRTAHTKAAKDQDFLRLDAEAFALCPSDSIDYAVMEKTDSAAVIPLDAGWSDVGSWSALWEIAGHDDAGNSSKGDVILHNAGNCFVSAGSRLVAVVGMNNCVIVETPDAVLVADKDQVQDVKQIVTILKRDNRPEAITHQTVYRPWGSYQSIDAAERFQVKRITVKPGASLSLQMHHHRAEHWIVVSGTAKVVTGDKETILSENQSTYIPLGVTHRLENPGVIPLELIEVQSGSYLGEDDIVRFEDVYGRS